MKRSSGVLLHPTSLPSPFGIGDFGHEAFAWIMMLKNAGQSYWQFCPLGPTGDGNSPYQCRCSFAGNPLLISPLRLMERGLLTRDDFRDYPSLSNESVDYAGVASEKGKLFRKAFNRFAKTDAFVAFCERESFWLDDYALFCVAKKIDPNRPWIDWAPGLKRRDASALDSLRNEHRVEVAYHSFLQFIFFEQCNALKEHAKANGVRLIGDIPIYVALDSCDAWASPSQFEFDAEMRPLRVSGVPPDYYAETGQLWGNPLYRWDVMKRDGYAWWRLRVRKALEFADIVRLDHFRGFESFWAVAAGSPTAVNGAWIKGPGIDFFNRLQKEFGNLPFIAEDLGDITPAVEQLRDDVGLPGMKVLQFAFDGNPKNPHLPYAMIPASVVYTGTHDNDTTAGWLDTISGVQRRRVDAYLGTENGCMCDDLVRCAFATVSDLCVVPLQDVLGLDSRHRMNTPGKAEDNWRWRCPPNLFTQNALGKIKEYSEIYGRSGVKRGTDEPISFLPTS